MMKSMLLELDHRASVISGLGALLICSAYLTMNAINYVGEDLVKKIFFVLLSIGLIFLSFPTRKKHWFLKTFFELCLYNLLDEIIGRACVIDYFEVIGAIFLILYNWKTWKH